jgi:hypothetical protein
LQRFYRGRVPLPASSSSGSTPLLAHRVPRLGNRSRSGLDNHFLAVRDRAPIFSPGDFLDRL